MSAQRKLLRWMEIQGWTQRDLARRLGVNQSGVCRWLNGENRPSWPVIVRVYEVTEGHVAPGDWAPPLPTRAHEVV
jgi:transcriptional regulator with XRE-family HTH domain